MNIKASLSVAVKLVILLYKTQRLAADGRVILVEYLFTHIALAHSQNLKFVNFVQ